MLSTWGYSRKNPETSAGTKWDCTCNLGHPNILTPLLCKLHWVPTYFWIKLKVLVVTFKTLHDTGPGYLPDHIHPIISVHSLNQAGKACNPKNSDWQGSGREFSLLFPHTHSVEHSPPRSEQTPILLIFQKGVKTWSCTLAWDAQTSTQPRGYLVLWKSSAFS